VLPPLPSATFFPSTTPIPSKSPTVTPLPPTLTATPLLINGTLTIKVNVRSGPGISYASLGQLGAGENVQVIAREVTGAWYQILYPASPEGSGWVTAQYVKIPTGTQVPLQPTPTPPGPTGRVIQRLNVRSGPGTTFNSIGILEPGASVSLTGKNSTASWLQITYTAGPGGIGWVIAQYIQTDSTGDLPVLDESGNIVTPGVAGTPSGPGPVPTPTIGPALTDGDSSAIPAINVTLSSLGTTRFIYSSQVSTPQGDPEDWIAFTPYSSTGTNARLIFSLSCTGNDTLTVELLLGGSLLSGWGTLECGDKGKSILLPAGQMILVNLKPAAGNGLRLVAYTLDVQNRP
jgi:uncharacterized protein YraI